MIKELKYMIIEYTEEDLKYIDSFFGVLDSISEEIISFLDIKSFGDKVRIVLNNNLDDFRKKYIQTGFNLDCNGNVPEWTCGFASNNVVETLCLKEYRKTKSHEKDTFKDLLYLILHEFVHACHEKANLNTTCVYAWFGEGLATTISHQFESAQLVFNANLNQIMYGSIDYRNYHTMFKYVLETYGRDYILKLLNDDIFLKSETPKLYGEVWSKYNSNVKGK